MVESSEIKKGRGRPKGSTNKSKASTVKKNEPSGSAEIASNFFGLIESFAVARYGELVAFTDEERQQLSKHVGHILDKTPLGNTLQDSVIVDVFTIAMIAIMWGARVKLAQSLIEPTPKPDNQKDNNVKSPSKNVQSANGIGAKGYINGFPIN